MQTVDYDQIGKKAKLIRVLLVELHEEAYPLPIGVVKHLTKSIDKLDSFRNLAEEEMLKQDPLASLDVFYGDLHVKEGG